MTATDRRRIESTATLQRALARSGWTVTDLFVAAWAVGGEFEQRDIASIAAGSRAATPAEHDVLAVAFNDYFVDHGQDHPVAAWNDLRPLPSPESG